MRLEAASSNAPRGLEELITDLGAGENGFGGTPVHNGELTLEEYLQRCIEMMDVEKLSPGYVPQTVFWVVDEAGEAIGMVRMRHYLNAKLKERGGHIGYYIRHDKRGKGYAKEALRQALVALRMIGEKRAMLTVNMDNLASIKVIESNGGMLESQGEDAEGKKFGRFWIELD
ncbi:MAG TPA: GNAT family N-acetyltransferase [Anaerolineales bacterium]|nr:GNAT family N-acetyltransferase [Anaerolineales bacterium]HLO31176.1 GNAT family N-acetyltransferase [Anaerolineales bacterium]